ncbi:MAG: hypothetical protein FWG44_01420 [Oscillospiraceae bacterium]|nr:hypothetical protein [Oscillospiraceae bacterium]
MTMTCELNKINIDLTLEFLDIKGDVPENIKTLINHYEPLLRDKITPRYVYKTFPFKQFSGIQINAPLQGNDIKAHLKDCKQIVLLAATLGLPADEFIRMTEAADMAGAVVLDALASAAVEQTLDIAEREIKKKYTKITTRYSPGYGDFPLTVQQKLLAILGAKRKIGLYANESDLLIPRKSVTAVIGIIT